MTVINLILWKNLEGICLENEFLSVVVLPSLGGKIASLFDKKRGVELAAQNHKESYQLPKWGADFSRYDASGLDEAFPNIVETVMKREGQEYIYPDHGEIWSSPFSYDIVKSSIRLSYKSKKLGYVYEKRITLRNNGVLLDYHISNMRSQPFPCIWTFHGLMRYEEDMELIFPEDARRFENVFESRELGCVGERYDSENLNYDFRRVPHKKTKSMVKFYVEGKLKKGFCGYRYPALGVECRYHYDAKKFPYLGAWITTGGFRGDYNCALEPANGYYDDIKIAERNNTLYYLKKEKPLKFSLKIEVCDLKSNGRKDRHYDE